MRNVVIVAAKRTPVGAFGGAFQRLLPTDLVVPVMEAVIQESGLDKSDIQEVILGQCIQRTDQPNTARTASLLAGLPPETTGFTIQRQCASGLQAILTGAMQIQTGLNDVVIAGGVEAMSTSPYILKEQRWGARLQHSQIYDSVWEVLEDPIHHIMMGETAEILAEKYEITREEQDNLALLGHERAIAAQTKGYFDEQVVPITIKERKEEKKITLDEGPKSNISLEKLQSLRPAFRKDGTVTAGNASSLNDGAACVVLMAEEVAKEKGIKPLAVIKGFHVSGVDPKEMGIGPVPAIRQTLQKTNSNLEDIDLFEINEAFAAQYIAVEKELKLDRNKVNVNGSGISLGHPVGCTGTRIVVSLIHELKRRQIKKGIASLCVGGGMGAALLLEIK
ncbi:thiolase family protein [Bacillus sp. FJAT-45066]|uniref:thiolase family protein n=1 Tax=Bacillus sp. FJAT-45066 TaxID=2011010 RepID=UPI000BB9AD04|nr:thiolase family protein [Bacillus sp. FJAT-45066]